MDPSVDPKHRPIDWVVVVGIGAMHLGCLLAPFTFTWSGLGLMLALWFICGTIGITLCYHRLLTHRSFQTPKIVEYLLTVIGTLNWQGGPVRWVGTHRLHHRDSDQAGDPHSPEHGFTWSHVLWTLHKDGPGFRPYEAAKDLLRDPVTRGLDRFFYLPQFALCGLLYGVGHLIGGPWLGLSWLIWGTCVRTVVGYHATWFVNSASHTWGYRNFHTPDGSRNNWWVALLTCGEGWHNNHHAQQRSAAHGMRWFELDVTYVIIRLMEAVGLARKVVRPVPPARRRAKAPAALPSAVAQLRRSPELV
jgi:sn-1 stearoyl-lipid 9-desaturase